MLVDCLTLWLSNLMHAGADVDEATDDLVRALDGYAAPVVFVSNELGLGLVPETPLGRSFRDAMGRLNMRVAERADRVIFMAAGLPLLMKDRPAPPPAERPQFRRETWYDSRLLWPSEALPRRRPPAKEQKMKLDRRTVLAGAAAAFAAPCLVTSPARADAKRQSLVDSCLAQRHQGAERQGLPRRRQT